MTSDASARQNRASHPETSTWVSANAGSGKTRVLTDRVARLLLAKNPPQKILCLTYTKAAAAEMQNRLFSRLGTWAMMDDAALKDALTMIGENGQNYNDTALKRTRTHFARALETPGGLKIQTIHAFCASLLRRFPIEAAVSPQFREMEEGQAALLRSNILDEMARAHDPTAFDALARHLTNEDGLDGLLMDILKNKHAFSGFDRDAFAKTLRVDPNATQEDIQSEALNTLRADLTTALISYLASSTTKAETKAGAAMVTALDQTPSNALETLEQAFLTQSAKTPVKSGLPAASTKKSHQAFADALERIKAQIFEARQTILAVRVLNRTQDLHIFASQFIARYEAAKAAQNLLDFDDLITKTRTLLSRQEMTQWVLYRLDNGIDHILVDEAQDTSPAQWSIIESLSQEFTSGMGASPINRTLFVVGDKKQSIFGFQGADPDEFHTKQLLFSDRFRDARKKLEAVELPTSFRSAAPILNLVDRIFFDDKGALGGAPSHEAIPNTPGRVDLWDYIPNEPPTDKAPWWDPVDTIAKSNPIHQLAVKIADYISGQISSETLLHTKDGTRPVKPGDYLILVRSRSPFFHILIEKLKASGVPVAGADRMKIREQLAVRDLLSLLKFLDNELDDLSLAEALRSPIFGLTENDLFALAHGRPGTLWESLRKSEHTHAIETLNDLRKTADFIRPYEILSRILTRHGARIRLTARLGMECEDAIDELLAQSIAFEALEAPTLGGFLHWLSARSVEIKRDMEAGRNEVRVMTVHGAKGLEAPIVIIPDTTELKSHSPTVGHIADQAFWHQTKLNEPQVLLDVGDAQKNKDIFEYVRLLYVALTRAENWLIVAGAGKRSQKNEDRWYNRVEAAMAAMNPITTGDVQTITHNWNGEAQTQETPVQTAPVKEPWLTSKPSAQPTLPKPLSPSSFDGPHALPGDYEADGTKRGDLIHKLLELLPGQPQTNWHDIAKALCGEDFDAPDILKEVSRVILHPDHQAIFAPETLIEVPITATLAALNNQTISGRIDRLCITLSKILAIDFKSNLIVPETLTAVPKAILQQQGAYAAALSQIFPDRRIETAVIWTKTAEKMPLPFETVMEALKSATPITT